MIPDFNLKSSIGTLVTTGHDCPESGIWKVHGILPIVTAPIAKGNKMPPYKGYATSWELIEYA
jgi:hypothetical protein